MSNLSNELARGDVSPATLTVAAVARRIGVAPATLRTWDRRYGLGPSTHLAGSHRRYSAEDLARLVIMRRLTHEGVSPSEAARLAIAEEQPLTEGSNLAQVIRLVPDSALRGAFDPPARVGGRAEPPPESSPMVRGLTRASMALDANGVTEVLRRQVAGEGVIRTWDALIAPVLVGLGERWAATGEGIEVEHLFSECVMGVMRASAARLREPRNTVPVLLGCLDEEQHSLPIHALAAALAERGVGARQLGSRIPSVALASAVRRSGPGVVFLFASMPVASAADLAHLGRVRPAPRVLVGGAGWPADLPPSVRRLPSLQQAVDVILAAVL